MNSGFGDSKIYSITRISWQSLQLPTWWFGVSSSRLHFGHKEDSARPVVFLCRSRLQCPVKTCTTLFKWGLFRLRRRIVSREDVQPTDSFILKQSFRLFHIFLSICGPILNRVNTTGIRDCNKRLRTMYFWFRSWFGYMVCHFVAMYPCMPRNPGNTDVVLFTELI